MQHIWTILNENTHIFERNTIEIDKRGNNFIHTLSFFFPRKRHRNENGFLTKIYNRGMLTSFFHSKVTWDTNFLTLSSGSVALQPPPPRYHIF